jgi:hypothetical protein
LGDGEGDQGGDRDPDHQEEGMPTVRSGSAAELSGGVSSAILGSNFDTRSFWMTPKLSSIVILNLIANWSFLYHKPEKHAVNRID